MRIRPFDACPLPWEPPSESRKIDPFLPKTHRNRAKIDPFPWETYGSPGKTDPISPKPGRFSRKKKLVSAKIDQVPGK